MPSETLYVRLTDEAVLNAVAAYAAAHKVSRTVAVARLLAEWVHALPGKTISRFATIDPEADLHFSLALGELRSLNKTLSGCRAALTRPRPIEETDLPRWLAQQDKADQAIALVSTKIRQVKSRGNMEFLLHDVDPKKLEKVWEENPNSPEIRAVFGALLGKPVTNPVTVPAAETKTAKEGATS